MANVEKMSKEELEDGIWWEKRAKKILLICSAICCGLGIIIGVVTGTQSYGSDVVFNVFAGIWFGTGGGGIISCISAIPHVFKKTLKEEGFKKALTTTLYGFLGLLVIFVFVGPITLLVRILRMNFRIKKFEKRLSELG